ncbi:MAG: M15 family metallopeptidase [Legionellaceae bacterium]|nr:M15 family metallopeptidase [Legionellaceae bacterium]
MLFNRQLLMNILLSLILVTTTLAANAQMNDLIRLKNAYPDHIIDVSKHNIIWMDGTSMPALEDNDNKTLQEKLESPSLLDQLTGIFYIPGIPKQPELFIPKNDPGRVRYEPFFLKMYGQSEHEVIANLVTIYWMPTLFGTSHPLQVTKVNNVDRKLARISHELEQLVAKHPEYLPFLDNPGGTFKWRLIANSNRISMHSFGMTIDINSKVSDYWQWELKGLGLSITEDAPLNYRNSIPWDIVPIFEKYGFIWGGKWHHYDSMHFEYRPELFA